jgi:hypothetical protein
MLRLRALVAMGWSAAQLANFLVLGEHEVQRLISGTVATAEPGVAFSVRELFDAIWDLRPPERTRSERSTATAARRRAAVRDWCCGAGLDDDRLDADPAYKPEFGYRPATGVDVADDISLQTSQAGVSRRDALGRRPCFTSTRAVPPYISRPGSRGLE